MGPKRAVESSDRKAQADGRIALSIRLDSDAYESLRRLAFDRRVTMLSLIAEGVAMVLKKAGSTK